MAQLNSRTGEAEASSGAVTEALVLALESAAGATSRTRFARAALSAIQGNLPYQRYFAAGRQASRMGAREGAIERAIWDWMPTSCHPLHGFLLGANDPRSVVDGMNAYNARDIGGAWDREHDGGPPYWILTSGTGKFRLDARRVSPDGFDDPEACQSVSLGSIRFLAENAQRRAGNAQAERRTLSSIALHLGVERSAAAEVAWIFEREGRMSVDDLSGRLGCKKRTLERELQDAGLTAGKLRLACMVVGATNQLHSDASLTHIAADQGFADLAHMTRTFKSLCGLSPSTLRGARSGASGSANTTASRYQLADQPS